MIVYYFIVDNGASVRERCKATFKEVILFNGLNASETVYFLNFHIDNIGSPESRYNH